MNPAYLPNIITVFRLLLVGPIVVGLLMEDYKLAFFLFLIAGLTDAVDGYLARRFQWISRWGAMVDPLADKLLMVSSYLTLTYLSILPVWLLALVLTRDVVIVTGGMCYHFLIGQYDFKPSLISKANTFFQIVLVIVVLSHYSYGVFNHLWINILIYLVLFTTASSMIHYIWVWGWRAFSRKGDSRERH
ncbi:MAG: CDP-alcohol phosphatidyltransferase family protein [Gammaproteobacteria bacterium]|nr:CDP-alcohol phosphatidyltransferase family protein [Gammaproteobacteria bacterium]